MSILFLIISTFTLILSSTHSLPFVLFHGIQDSCSHKGVKRFTDYLTEASQSQGYCIEIGDGVCDSWFMPFSKQTKIACEKVKEISELNEGYNIVGLSQGNLIGRGVVEFCDEGPPVKNFISLAGPHAGIASIPFWGSGWICLLVDDLMKLAVYSDFVQKHLAPANYIKIPTDINGYKRGCKFLPKLNNEMSINITYKERFSSLQNLVLIMFDEDKVLVPKETSWFGYYPDGSLSTVLVASETELYIDDWVGLKTLDDAGKVTFVNVSGGHLEILYTDMDKYVVPYLVEDGLKKPRVSSFSSSFNKYVEKDEEYTDYLRLNILG